MSPVPLAFRRSSGLILLVHVKLLVSPAARGPDSPLSMPCCLVVSWGSIPTIKGWISKDPVAVDPIFSISTVNVTTWSSTKGGPT